jgi:hypothetical protein
MDVTDLKVADACAARQHEQGSQRIERRVVERFREDSLAGRRAIPGD